MAVDRRSARQRSASSRIAGINVVSIEWCGMQLEGAEEHIFIVRDELRLSVPLGVAFVFDHEHAEKQRRARVVLALIPEITLRARNLSSA